jgi:acetylornithine/N-succinyldiaminopimelate aminotransferase
VSNWQDLEKKYYMPVFHRAPLTIVRGRGTRVWDENGIEYIDFVGGLAVDSLGHCHPVVTEAVSEQVKTLIQTSNHFYTIPQLKLAELLAENSCLDKVFICNSGTEATEGAVKLARRYGHKHLCGAYEVITVTGSFHGRTLAMVSASGQSKFQQPYTPLPSGFINVEYNNIEAMKAAINKKTCAVMLEPVQGESGVRLPAPGYLQAVRQLCNERGLLLILDEIQTGMGRTGSLFAYQQFGIEPDIMTLAKGMASGIPIGAILAKEKASVFAIGEHGSTFGGNPVACAAGYATLKYMLDNNIAEKAKLAGERLTNGLKNLQQKYKFVTEVRGLGLLQAMEFDQCIAGDLMLECMEQRLLVNVVQDNALRFVPPLIVSEAEIDLALDILDRVLSGVPAATELSDYV